MFWLNERWRFGDFREYYYGENAERHCKKMIRTIKQVAKYVYKTLGAGHEEAIYRDAMSVELQDRGYTVKTEAPISIRYKTKKGKEMIVGSGKIDPYVTKGGKYAVIELKTVSKILKENSKKTKEDTKEYHQLKKYLEALDVETGVLINFPFPPEKEPEVIE
ncbi:MAG: GxxExxY protein [SAR202 cluster bacterium]|nr:GxxExxY protein [SAR202 cluster bacterium]